jgi:hypothetical protein
MTTLLIAYEAERDDEKAIKVDGVLLLANAPAIGTLCVFGVRGEEVIDLKISAIRYTTDLNAEISAVNYSTDTAPEVPT